MPEPIHKPVSVYRTLFICCALLIVTILVISVIFTSEPQAKREAATKRTPMLVEVVTLEAGDFRPSISAMGTVKAEQSLNLRARVQGEVQTITAQFFPGSKVAAGQLLAEIDPADYQLAYEQAVGRLAESESALSIEMGEQSVAKREYERLYENRQLQQNLSDMQKSLLLRKPQLQAAKASVESAKAAVRQADLNLQRTHITAPFDAMVLSRDTAVGAHINQGDVISRLVGTNRYWVEARLPLSARRWLAKQALPVTIRDHKSWLKSTSRQGRLHSIIDELDAQSRMIRVLVEVDDPLALHSDSPALVAGAFVECEFPAVELSNVVRIPRDYVRKGDTLWLMADNKLVIQSVNVLLWDAQYAYVDEGVQGGESLVTTSLARVRDGAELRLAGASQ